MVAEATHLDIQKAEEYLLKHGSVRLAVKAYKDGN